MSKYPTSLHVARPTSHGRSLAADETLADLEDHRARREDMRSAAEPAATVNAVAVLVVAIHGSVDQGGLRQLIETQLLASDRVAAVHGTDVSALPQVPTSSQSAKLLTVDRLRMDLDEMRVSLSGRPIYFTHQEFLLLKTFMLSPRRVLSRKQLLDQAWEYGDWGGGRTVDVHVRRLRVKLGVDAPQIVTVRGFGYRFEPRKC